MNQGILNWTYWRRIFWDFCRTIFFVVLVVVNLNHTYTIHAAHGNTHLAAQLRMTVTVGCIAGMVYIHRVRWRIAKLNAAAKRNSPALGWPDEIVTCKLRRQMANAIDLSEETTALEYGPALTVTYRNSPEASWRCQWYVLSHQPVVLCAAALWGWPATYELNNYLHFAYPTLPQLNIPLVGGIVSAIVFGLLVAVYLLCVHAEDTTVRLTPDGVVHISPDTVTAVPWSKVHAVRKNKGDVLFWVARSPGMYVPRTGFASPEESARFYEAAMSLWRTRGATWAQVAPLTTQFTGHIAEPTAKSV